MLKSWLPRVVVPLVLKTTLYTSKVPSPLKSGCVEVVTTVLSCPAAGFEETMLLAPPARFVIAPWVKPVAPLSKVSSSSTPPILVPAKGLVTL